jgi:D-alanyl-D-alanine carboxypeptidase
MRRLEQVCEELVAAGARGALAHAAGNADEEWAAAGSVSTRDRFRTGSVTKTAVAALVLLLAGDSLLRLDAPARDWADVPGAITVRDLLQHTSGLPDYVANPVFLERFMADQEHPWSARELLELAGRTEATTGSFVYSNTNFVVLGLVAEATGGASLGHLLAERIFEPLALHDSELATAGGAAAGGLVSTAGDVARLLRGLLGGELLSPASLAEMLTTVPGDGVEFTRYGLGIAELDSFLGLVFSPCGSAWGHLGLLPDCTCAALSTRDGRRQAVLMALGPASEAFGAALWAVFCG